MVGMVYCIQASSQPVLLSTYDDGSLIDVLSMSDMATISPTIRK
jgi:hypothetical protein